jgi:hypothetical protein
MIVISIFGIDIIQKKKMLRVFCILSLLTGFLTQALAQASSVEHVFTLNETNAVEGMTYDPISKHFYFGADTDFKILRYTLTGKAAGFIDGANDGMTSVLGMTVDSDKHDLWICGAITVDKVKVRTMFRYDLNTLKLIERYPDESKQAKLFNDVAITSDGTVYTTDTYTKSLYKVDTVSKTSVLYLQHDLLEDGNGISAHGDVLYISTAKGITRVNTNDKSVAVAPLEGWMIAGSDGLYFYKNSLIGIQNVFFPLTVVRYFLDDSGTKIQRGSTLAAGHTLFNCPTTGAVIGDEFYFMGNNNISTRKENRKKVTIVKLQLSN